MSKNRILLWTAPRCVSTAFERSIMNLKNSKIFHEPYSQAFYFGPEKQSARYAAQETKQQATYRSISKMLQKEYDGRDFVFSKEMAYCVENKMDIFAEEGFKNFQHSFLILSIPCTEPPLTRNSQDGITLTPQRRAFVKCSSCMNLSTEIFTAIPSS